MKSLGPMPTRNR